MCLLDLFKAFEIAADNSERLCELVNFLTDVADPDLDPTLEEKLFTDPDPTLHYNLDPDPS